MPIREAKEYVMPYDVMINLDEDSALSYATMGFLPNIPLLGAMPPRGIDLYPIAQKAAKAEWANLGKPSGEAYWVARIVDNMFTEKWAKKIWPMIGLTQESITKANAPEVGRLVANLMADPSVYKQLTGQEQSAEKKEREARKKSALKPLKIAAGVIAASVVVGSILKAKAAAGSQAASSVTKSTTPQVAQELAHKAPDVYTVPGQPSVYEQLKQEAETKVKDLAIAKAAEALAPQTASEISSATGQPVSEADVQSQLENQIRAEQGLAPKFELSPLMIGGLLVGGYLVTQGMPSVGKKRRRARSKSRKSTRRYRRR